MQEELSKNVCEVEEVSGDALLSILYIEARRTSKPGASLERVLQFRVRPV